MSVTDIVRRDHWPEPRRLGLDDATTVRRHLACKRTTEQVFVNDVVRDGDRLVALGDLPEAHLLFNDTAGMRHDAMMLAEFVRQAIEVLARGVVGVADSCRCVLRSVELDVVDPGATLIGPAGSSGAVSPAVVVVPAGQVRRGLDGIGHTVTGPVYCSIGGRPAARFSGTVAFLAADTYESVRAAGGTTRTGGPQGAVTPADPWTVGRQLRRNVLVGAVAGPPRAATGRVVPIRHPAFYDRPLDHYPGMMVAEAARQLAVGALAVEARVPAAALWVQSTALDFVSFAELDSPPALAVSDWADLPDGARITVTARQGDRTTSVCRFRILLDDLSGGSR